MVLAVILFGFSSVVFARDVVKVTAYKEKRMPMLYVDEHNPNQISFNKEYIESKPMGQNIFSIVEGSAVEYQKNVQDAGGHTGISINQLPFYYTGTFVDGIFIPDNSLDVSQFFGTHAVETIKVKRGAASVGTMPASLAGAVEITSRDANQDRSDSTALYGSYGTYNLSTELSRKVNKNSGVLLALMANGQNAIDTNNDRIAESPRRRNVYATLAHSFKNTDLSVKTRIDVSKNNRAGGSTIVDKSNTTGNPFDFSKIGGSSANSWQLPGGSSQTWSSGAVGFLEIIDTTRVSVLSSVESENYIGGGTVSLLKRDNFYSGNVYKADEINVFATLARKLSFGNTKFKIGGDFLNQTLSSTVINDVGQINNPDGYVYTTASLFGEVKHEVNNWDFDAAARLGIHNVMGILGTVRTRAGYHHTDNISSVLAIGNGYHIPGSSFEQNHELVGGEIHTFTRNITKPTQSFNASYNAVFTYDKVQATVGYNYNRLDNISFFDMSHVHAGAGHGDIDVVFRSLNGYYQNHGINFDGTYLVNRIFSVNFGAERYWHDFSHLENGFVMLARPDYKISTKLITQTEKHRFIFGGTLFGRSNLRQFYGTTYNLQGQENPKFSPQFVIFDFDASYKITGALRLLYGVNNITDYVQVRYLPRVGVVSHGDEYELHARNAWGPVVGRRFYVGLNWQK